MYENNFRDSINKAFHLILILNCCSLYCMEIIKDTPIKKQKWNGEEYNKGNKIQTDSFLYFLENNKIVIKDLSILDVGCGTGIITAKLAETALYSYGIDASKSMIKQANKNFSNASNLFFEKCRIEEFKLDTKFKLAVCSSAFLWFDDRENALKKIYDHLEDNGEFFANIHTNDSPTPIAFEVLNEMKQAIPTLQEHLNKYPQISANTHYPSLKELKNLFTNTGFKILKTENQSYSCNMTKEEFENYQLPPFKNRPGINELSSDKFQSIFEEFIKRCLNKLKQNNDGTYHYQLITMIFHTIKREK